MAILNHGSTIRTTDGGQTTTTIVTAANIGSYAIASNATYYIGTTQNVFNRASGAQTLTGVSIDGNAATVTNGVYTTGAQTIGGTKTFSDAATFSANATLSGSSQLFIGSYMSLQSSATILGMVGFNRKVSDGTIFNSSYAAYQLHNDAGTLNLQIYNSAGGFVGAHTFNSSGNITFLGTVSAATDFRAPVFYDSNNTAYYIDAASTSVINALSVSTLNNINAANGTWHTSSEGKARFYFASNGTTYFRTGNDYVFRNNSDIGVVVIDSVGNLRTSTSGDNSPSYSLHVGGTGFASADFRAPIFYDSGNTAYYLDPANSGTSLLVAGSVGIGNTSPSAKFHVSGASYTTASAANNNVRFEGGGGNGLAFGTIDVTSTYASWIQSGYVVNFATATYSLLLNPLGGNVGIGTTSPGYKLDITGDARIASAAGAGALYFGTLDTSNIYLKLDNNYDLSLVQNAASGNGLYLAGAGNVYVSIDSNNNSTIDAFIVQNNAIKAGTELFRVQENGVVTASTDFRAPIFYDSNDTGYYINPNGTSSLVNVIATEFYARNWFRNDDSGEGIYNQTTTQHFYSDDVSFWNVASSSGAQGIRFRTGGYNGTVRGYIYANDSNDVGLLNNSGNWRARVVGGDYFLADGSSIRGQIFYDSNDTNYYCDPNGSSVLASVTANAYYPRAGVTESDIYAQSLIINAYHHGDSLTYDTFQFNGASVYETKATSGSSFVSASVDTSIFKGDRFGGMTIANGVYQARWTWNNTIGYKFFKSLYIANSTNGNSFTVTIETSGNGTTWTTVATTGSMSNWPGHSWYNYTWNNNATQGYIRITVTPTWVNANTINIYNMRYFCSYNLDAGSRLYDWDYSKNVTFLVSAAAPIFYDSGDTNYYLDPAGTSRLNTTRIGNINVGSGTYLNTITPIGDTNINLSAPSGAFFFDTFPRMPGFYDSNNTAYYVDPASTGYSAYFAGAIQATKIGIEDSGLDCYMEITDANPVVYGVTYGGEFIFYGDKSTPASFLYYGGATVTYTLQANASLRAPIFYDSNDTNYYIDPASTSILNTIRLAGKLTNNGSVADDDGFGIYWENAESTSYAIYREAGSWTSPYPDLRIAFHTGIKLGANAGYNGIRFYNDYDMATQVMSVNNSGDGLGANNVYVNNALQAGGSLRAPAFFDSDDTNFYANPAGESKFNYLRLTNNTALYFTTTGAAELNNEGNSTSLAFRMIKSGSINSDGNNYGVLNLQRTNHTNGATNAGASIFFELKDSGGTIREYAGISGCKTEAGAAGGRLIFHRYARTEIGYWDADQLFANASMRSPVFYDSDNTAYYINPNSTTSLRTVGSWRSDSSSWDGEFNGKIQYHSNHWYFQSGDLWIFRNSGGTNVATINQSGVISAAFSGSLTGNVTGNVTGTAINIAGNSASADPYGTIAVTEPAGASNYSYYGLTRQANIGTGFGLTGTTGALGLGANAFWFGTSTSTAAGVMGSAYIAFNGSSFVTVGTVDGTQFRDRDNTSYYLDPANSTTSLLVAGSVGIGTTSPAYKLQVNGSFAATTKSFDIPHPTKENKRLVYASLEGPENGVYVRGKNKCSTIYLPDYWTGLVHKDSITVSITPIGKTKQNKIRNYSVTNIEDNMIQIFTDSEDEIYDFNYIVYAERKDVAKLVVEKENK